MQESITLRVTELVGTPITSRDQGELMRSKVEKSWSEYPKIVIDMGGMIIASVSFIDEAFAKLLEVHSLEDMKEKLSFINIDQNDRRLLNSIIISRKREKELSQT